ALSLLGADLFPALRSAAALSSAGARPGSAALRSGSRRTRAQPIGDRAGQARCARRRGRRASPVDGALANPLGYACSGVGSARVLRAGGWAGAGGGGLVGPQDFGAS